MTRALTRTNFNSSKLVRILTDMALVAPVEPGIAFAEKLGQWVDIAGAISLRAAHNASPPNVKTATQTGSWLALAEALDQMRAALANAMTKAVLPLDAEATFEPYRRYYLAHQREMELSVRTLRHKVRDALANASPALKQLASLDAAFDAILCERENKLFSTLPLLLAKRFDLLRKAHQPPLAESQQADPPKILINPGAWLARFRHELQTVLLAELDARLQPTEGLIEALHNEKTKQ